MQSLFALVVTVLAACAIAHPGDRVPLGRPANDDLPQPQSPLEPPPNPLNRQPIRDHRVPHFMVSRPKYLDGEKRVRIPFPPPQLSSSDWLTKEIERISRMREQARIPHKPDSELPLWLTHDTYKRIFGPVGSYGTRAHVAPYFDYTSKAAMLPTKALMAAASIPRKHIPIIRHNQPLESTTIKQQSANVDKEKERKKFAFTPMDKGYFTSTEIANLHNTSVPEGPHEGGGRRLEDEVDRRQTRQNPNLSRSKTLVAEDLDKIRQGLGSDDLAAAGSTDTPQNINVFGSEFAAETIYSVGVAAGVGTALFIAVAAFTFGWYTLSKRAKAAADVDYPAYGVTGPSVDSSGDRKLAHSAQMYHYQHQKQQIIAMERGSAERNESVSDPESEEENEEGDYTVYECPGFATTGDMEVKNPLFKDDKTPATPGKIEVVKPQPKE